MGKATNRSMGMHRLVRLWSVVTSALLLGVTLVAFGAPAPADALSGSEFNPGLIITDALFYDAEALSEGEIQAFLTAKGSGLRNMTFDVSSRPISYSDSTGNIRCKAFDGGHLSATAIIFRAQVACNISAKVILVTLQKEQGLDRKSVV